MLQSYTALGSRPGPHSYRLGDLGQVTLGREVTLFHHPLWMQLVTLCPAGEEGAFLPTPSPVSTSISSVQLPTPPRPTAIKFPGTVSILSALRRVLWALSSGIDTLPMQGAESELGRLSRAQKSGWGEPSLLTMQFR